MNAAFRLPHRLPDCTTHLYRRVYSLNWRHACGGSEVRIFGVIEQTRIEFIDQNPAPGVSKVVGKRSPAAEGGMAHLDFLC